MRWTILDVRTLNARAPVRVVYAVIHLDPLRRRRGGVAVHVFRSSIVIGVFVIISFSVLVIIVLWARLGLWIG